MTIPITIERIAEHAGQRVTVKGWLYASTHKGKLLFLRLRDGTGIAQAVAYRPEVGDERFEQLIHLGQESSLIVSGTVRENERAPGLPGGYEIGVEEIQVLQNTVDYPIGPMEYGIEFLMDNRHLWLRSSQQWAIMRVRATIKRAIIDFLDGNGFINIYKTETGEILHQEEFGSHLHACATTPDLTQLFAVAHERVAYWTLS